MGRAGTPRHGLAKVVVLLGLECAVELGSTAVCADVAVTNTRCVAVAEACGFTAAETLQQESASGL